MIPTLSTRWAVVGAVVLGFCAFSSGGLAAQNMQNGVIEGVVLDQVGDPIFDAFVVLSDQESSFTWTRRTDRTGRFRFSLLAPGNYSLFAETLGFMPKVTSNIPVLGGIAADVEVYLAPTAPPVVRVDTVSFAGGVRGRTRPGLGQWFGRPEIRGFPDRNRQLLDLTRLSSTADELAGVDGLPGSMTGVVVDGATLFTARHPYLSADAFRTSALPRSFFSQGFLLRNARDTEWGGAAGGFLVGQGRRAASRSEVEIFGDWTGSAMGAWTSEYLADNPESHNTYRFGATASIPITSDTTNLVIGFEGWNLELPRSTPLGAAELYQDLLDVLDPADAPRFEDLQEARLDRQTAYSGFARLDWAIGPTTLTSLRINVGEITEASGVALRGSTQGWDRVTMEGRDVSASGFLVSEISANTGLEIRAGFGSSTRDFSSGDVERNEDGVQTTTPATTFASYGLGVGSPPTAPASLSNSTFSGLVSGYYIIGNHSLKAGLAADYLTHDFDFLFGGTGQYFFTDPAATTNGEGWFAQAVGGPRGSAVTQGHYGAFLQDTWKVSDGLTVTLGTRYDYEQTPADELDPNLEWGVLTGTPNTFPQPGLTKLSSRVNVYWDVSGSGRTVVEAGAGVFSGMMDPSLWSEVLSQNGGVEARRAVGDLGVWPSLPDSSTAPITGPQLSILGPEERAPRTSRVTLGISQRLAAATWLHAGGSFRRTNFLPRRNDLNLSPFASGVDQFGRPLYGELNRVGELLVATPGSNRRFRDFDQVWALNTDGYSETRSVVVALEQGYRDWFDLFAEYTYSETTDDWFGARDGGPGGLPSPFPQQGESDDWRDGVSDFDVPHRLTVGLDLVVPQLRSLRLSGTYRMQSAYPFTPGFAPGVDANGDYVTRNDAAFVPDVPAIFDLADEWECIRDQLGQTAARNSCRAEITHALDLRLMYTFSRVGRGGVDLIVDWMNVLEPELGLRDTALLSVDSARDIVVDPETGETVLPFTVNPRFGQVLVGRSPGTFFRFGVRARF
jgi:hypothetical protein